MRKSTIYSELVEHYADVFINRWNAFSDQYVSEEGSRSGYYYHELHNPECEDRCEHCRCSDEETFFNYTHIESMLNGELSLGVCCITAEGTSRFCCWDDDRLDDRLDRIQTALQTMGVFSLRVSGRTNPETKMQERSGHLWVVLEKGAYLHASDWEIFRQTVCIEAGFKHLFPNRNKKCECCLAEMEFFPFLHKLGEKPNRSNLRMPLSRNLKPEANGQRGWFTDAPRNIIAQLRFLKEEPLNNPDKIQELIKVQKTITLESLNFDREFLRLKQQSQRRLSEIRKVSNSNAHYQPPRKLIEKYCEAEGLSLVRRGRNLYTLCPLCGVIEDGAEDNLMIQAQEIGNVFTCFAGKAAGTHDSRDLYRYLLRHYGNTKT